MTFSVQILTYHNVNKQGNILITASKKQRWSTWALDKLPSLERYSERKGFQTEVQQLCTNTACCAISTGNSFHCSSGHCANLKEGNARITASVNRQATYKKQKRLTSVLLQKQLRNALPVLGVILKLPPPSTYTNNIFTWRRLKTTAG